ncbi:MAG: NADH-quinone oxidoreductase subunit J [Candidatus Hatepunaea meridiana]|nr:NADH-quinone oxidoreductase subunit J [Candidatus Hatepunaea meridiana]
MELTLFIITALVALGSAIMVITRKSPIISVLFLVLTFFCLAVFYVMLGAQFIAAMQIIVYAGAIMVLFLFVLMLLNLRGDQNWEVSGPLRKWLGWIAAGGVLLVVITAIQSVTGFNTELDPAVGTVSSIGDALFNRFLLPFEIVSVMLLGAIIGVVAMVKRKPSTEDEEEGGEA